MRYSTVDPEQVAKENDERRRLRMAERKALNNSGNGIAGESTATIEGKQKKKTKKTKNEKTTREKRREKLFVEYIFFVRFHFLVLLLFVVVVAAFKQTQNKVYVLTFLFQSLLSSLYIYYYTI